MDGVQPSELTDGTAPADDLPHAQSEDALLVAEVSFRRDRLLAALTLIAGCGLVLAVPFALRAGAEFFLPVTAALVIAIALVPMLEWLERRRVPSPLAALTLGALGVVFGDIGTSPLYAFKEAFAEGRLPLTAANARTISSTL